MKKIIQTVVAVMVIANMTGCATSYMTDRRRDAADIFTATAGLGIGTNARIGPFHAGLSAYHDVVGIRGGRFSIYPSGIHGEPVIVESITLEGTFLSYEFSDPESFADGGLERFKRFEAKGFPLIAILDTSEERKEELSKFPRIHSYYTQIEVTASILGGVRLGFNPGELLDFILGWTTVDFFKDDLEAKDQKEKSNQSSEATPKSAPQ